MTNKNMKKTSTKKSPSKPRASVTKFGPLASAFAGPRKLGSELKHYTLSTNNRQFSHNGSAGGVSGADTSVLTPLQGLATGTNVGNRIGDDILAKKLDMNFFLSSKQDRPNVNYRLLVVVCPDNNGPSISQVLNTGGGNFLLNENSDERYLIIHDEIVPASVGAYLAGKEQSLVVKRSIPLNFPVSYGRSVNTPAHADLRIYALAYDAYGTLNTDNIASMSAHCTLFYLDP
jgi:hypothetical protein